MVHSDTTQSIQDFFAEEGKLLVFRKKDVILRPNETPSGVFFITRGYVKSYTLTNTGQTNLLIIYKAQELLPLGWAMGDHKVDCYYEAKTIVEGWSVPNILFQERLLRDPLLSERVTHQVLELMRLYSARIQTLEHRSARDRLAYYLSYLMERYGIARGEDVIIDAPITHQDLADSLNMSRETASREMEKLVRQGLIEQQSHLIVIKNYRQFKKTFE